jgi:hypothetical protein
MTQPAPSAASQPPSKSERRGFTAACQKLAASIARIASRMAWRFSQPKSAQVDALSSMSAVLHRKRLLLVEKEIVAAERKEAARKHRKVASFDARSREINAELLRIG